MCLNFYKGLLNLSAVSGFRFSQGCHFDEGEITLEARQRLTILHTEFLV